MELILDVIFLVIIVLFFKFLYDKDSQIVENTQIQTEAQISDVLWQSSDDIIGNYMSQPIYRYIKLQDGYTYEFESIAVEYEPGIYHADYIDQTYTIVNNNLLYRMVT